MAFDVGKRVMAESESTERSPRTGVIEEVLKGDPSPRYRIRWDDGHETIYTPAAGALRAGAGSRRRKGPSRDRQSAGKRGRRGGSTAAADPDSAGTAPETPELIPYYTDVQEHIHLLE
jgi:Domain of unknown function (DUF1918)